MSVNLRLSVNGSMMTVCESLTLSGLIEAMDVEGRYAVEVNGEIVPKSQHGQYTFAEGDAVEVVIAVGGG